VSTFARSALLLALCLCASCERNAAQGWPNKPIRFIAPFAPGGPADTIGRLIGYRLSTDLGQQVIVENRPGAGGNIGTAAAAKSAPDGYTALVTTSAFAVNVTLSSASGYDAEKDFIPTALVASTRPPCASARWRTMARPSPVPPSARERPASTR